MKQGTTLPKIQQKQSGAHSEYDNTSMKSAQLLPDISSSKKSIHDVQDWPPDAISNASYKRNGKSPYMANQKGVGTGLGFAKDNFKDTAVVQAKLQHQTQVNDNLRKELF